MAAAFYWPPNTRLWCRGCRELRPHNVAADRGAVECGVCKRRIHTIEVVATYATDRNNGRWEVLPPLELCDPAAYVDRVFGGRG